jgi:hypothetical protein
LQSSRTARASGSHCPTGGPSALAGKRELSRYVLILQKGITNRNCQDIFFFARKLSRIFETKNEKDLDVNGSPHIVLFLELLFCWYPVLQLPTALAELPEERLQAGERMFSEQSCQRVC